MSERRVLAGRYRYIPSISIEESRGHTSKLDLWAHPERIKRCQWVPRYFRVYVADRDGPLDKLEVRKNGVKFGPKSGRAVTLEIHVSSRENAGDTDFYYETDTGGSQIDLCDLSSIDERCLLD